MTITRGLTASVIAAGVALAWASPAGASEPMQGVYTINEPGVLPVTWQIFPVCVRAGCALRVAASTPHKGPNSDAPPYNGDARLSNDLWTMQVRKLEGLTCPDGSAAPTLETYIFDDVTLSGTHVVTHNPECGLQAGMTKQPFTLSYSGPLPIPVEPDPLICDFAVQCF